MGGIEFLDPVGGCLTDSIDHRGLADSRGANEEKGGMRAALEPIEHGFFNKRMKTCCFLFDLTCAHEKE